MSAQERERSTNIMDDPESLRRRRTARGAGHAYRAGRLPLLVGLLVGLVGCDTMPSIGALAPPTEPIAASSAFVSEPQQSARVHEDLLWRATLVTRDLVGALSQLPGAIPAHTIVPIEVPRSGFEHVLQAELQRAGYALRLASTPSEAALRYTVRTEPSADPDTRDAALYVFELAVGRIALRRRYRIDACGVAPRSSLFVRGDDARRVVMNDSRFARDRTC